MSLSYERQSQSELTDHSPDLLNPMAQPECAGALLLFPGCLDGALSFGRQRELASAMRSGPHLSLQIKNSWDRGCSWRPERVGQGDCVQHCPKAQGHRSSPKKATHTGCLQVSGGHFQAVDPTEAHLSVPQFHHSENGKLMWMIHKAPPHNALASLSPSAHQGCLDGQLLGALNPLSKP